MQLSDLIGKLITLRKKQFIGTTPYYDVVATVLDIKPLSVKCKLGISVIYIPKKYFTKENFDLHNRIIHLPTWFSFMSKEDLNEKLRESRENVMKVVRENTRFLIISTGYNCAEFVQKNYNSFQRQTYPNWHAIMISDGSTDDTNRELDTLPRNKITVQYCKDNAGAAVRRYEAIHKYGLPNDVIVLVGMDDELLPNALERIKKECDNGMWMTYGNWKNQHGIGLPSDFQIEFDEETHRTRNYRQVKYRSTAPNTFRKFLFDKINPDDFKVDGSWIMQTTESPVMFACLEMCGKERIGVIHDQIYLYNQRIKKSAKNRLGRDNQDRIYQAVTNIKKYQLYEKIRMAESYA